MPACQIITEGQRTSKLRFSSIARPGDVLWIPGYCARSDAIVQSEGGRSTRPRFSSFGECIRLASRYVTSLENQLVPNLLHPPFGLLFSPFAPLHSLQQPCQPILANHRCNLTQPSRNRSNPPSPCFLLIFLRLTMSPCLPVCLQSLRSHFLHVPANTVCNDRPPPSE